MSIQSPAAAVAVAVAAVAAAVVVLEHAPPWLSSSVF
jgi:hypothetical protein